jgi:hypothetical protein
VKADAAQYITCDTLPGQMHCDFAMIHRVRQPGEKSGLLKHRVVHGGNSLRQHNCALFMQKSRTNLFIVIAGMQILDRSVLKSTFTPYKTQLYSKKLKFGFICKFLRQYF